MSEPSPMLKTVAIKNFLRQCVNRAGHEPERLLGEMELTEKFNVSRSTVRSAIEAMEKAAYIIRIPGRKGAFTNPVLSGAVPYLIGIVVDNGYSTHLPFHVADILSGVIGQMKSFLADYEFVSLNGVGANERIRELSYYAFDAILYFSDNSPEYVVALNQLIADRMPVVIVDAIDHADVKRCISNSISYDFATIGYRHARCVLNEKCENIVYVGEKTSTFNTFAAAMVHHRIKIESRNVIDREEEISVRLPEILNRAPIDGIIADGGAPRYLAIIDVIKSRPEWSKIKLFMTVNAMALSLARRNPELNIIWETRLDNGGKSPLCQEIVKKLKGLITGTERTFPNFEYKIDFPV